MIASASHSRSLGDAGEAFLTFAALGLGGPLPAALAAANDVVTYDNSAGSESLRTVFGVGYVLLVAFFAIRLLTKRAKRAKSESVRGARAEDSDAPPPPPARSEDERASPLGALYGAAQATFLFVVLWTLTSSLSGYFDSRPLPSNYTARNIGVTVKTVIEGLAYLLTFIFGANAVGLTALAVQLALFPASAADQQQVPKAADPAALPKIALTDDIFSIRKAFEEAQRQGTTGARKSDSSSEDSGRN